MTIELRLTDIDPPTAEPARTIYHDIASLPDPVIQGITIRYFNYDDSGLYMQITGSGTGYTFTPVNLGLLATGANAYKNLDAFASRAKPTVAQVPNGEMSENITLTLKAYTNAGYTNLKWTFDRVVTVIWINSADAAYTVDKLDNFDDGTVQGWSYTVELACSGVLSVASNYVLSTPYSLNLQITTGGFAVGEWESRIRFNKTFNTTAKTKQYAIIDIRIGGTSPYADYYLKYLKVSIGTGGAIIYLGQPYDGVHSDYIPRNRWLRIVIPLTPSTSTDLRIAIDSDTYVYVGGYGNARFWMWMDDFKIISK